MPIVAAAATATAGGGVAAALSAALLLMVQLRRDPVALDTTEPLVFTWALPPDQPAQRAFQLQLLPFTPGGDTPLQNTPTPTPTPIFDTNLISSSNQSFTLGPAIAAKLLAPETLYSWRVRTTDASNATRPWSDLASFGTALAPATLATVSPIWSANASAGFVFLRSPPLVLPSAVQPSYALLYVTANPQTTAQGQQNAKLFASYKMRLNGQLVGVGPGRIAVCGPVCPIQNAATACDCQPHHFYDAYNVTDLVHSLVRAQSTAAGNATLQLTSQSYMSALYGHEGTVPAALYARLVLHYPAPQAPVVLTTSPAWRTFDADAYVNPTCCASAYSHDQYQPHNNFDARLEPLGWPMLSYNDSAWPSAVAVPHAFSAPLLPKPTAPVATLEHQPPAGPIVVVVPAASGSAPTRLFVDFGLEAMGGVRLTFTDVPAALANSTVEVRMGEALIPNSGTPPRVRYQMNTGNVYRDVYTLRATTPAAPTVVFEQHEYSEFRYAEILLSPDPVGSTCAVSAPGDYATPVTLQCGDLSAVITNVSFAAYGTPGGSCDADPPFSRNSSCDCPDTPAIVARACLGRHSCTLTPSDSTFCGGADPCHRVDKHLVVAVHCNGSAPAPAPPLAPPTVERFIHRYPADYSVSAFSSSSPLLDAVYNFTKYTIVATTLDMYTDSNTRQRDVMCGESVNVNSLYQWATSLEFAVQRYSERYLLQQRGWGGPGAAEWPIISVFHAHHDWMQTGRLDMFAEHYARLKNWTEAVLIDSATGLWTCAPCGGLSRVPCPHPPPSGVHFNCEGPEVDWPSAMRDGFVYTPANMLVNAYVFRGLLDFVDMARALGTADALSTAARYQQLAATLQHQANARLFNGTRYLDGLGTTHSAWHTNVFAAVFGVAAALTPAQQHGVVAYVIDRCREIDGVVGNVYLAQWSLQLMFDSEFDFGVSGLALLTANGTNSWASMMRANATCTMEAWTEDEKPNLTYSHPWAASPVDIITRFLMGIRALEPGWSTFRIKPQLGNLTRAAISVPSIRGIIPCVVEQSGVFGVDTEAAMRIAFTVPGNTLAKVLVPYPAAGLDGAMNGAACALCVDGGKVQGVVEGRFCAAPLVGAGNHIVTASADPSRGTCNFYL